MDIDVRPSADGQSVVIHDPDTRRLGGPRFMVGRETVAELRGIDAGPWRQPRQSGEGISLLAMVVRTVLLSGRLFVELKEGPTSVPVVAALRRVHFRAAQLLVMGIESAMVLATVAALQVVDAYFLRTVRK